MLKLNELKTWLELNRPRVDKGGLTGKAMTYLHNQWEKLMVYSTDGRLRLSNILAENAIRPFAVGRRAWLFADTPAGANASAIHYSLIETPKFMSLNPMLISMPCSRPYHMLIRLEKSMISYLGISKIPNPVGYPRTFNRTYV